MKQGQETNQIWTQEAGTHDTHNRTLTPTFFQADSVTLNTPHTRGKADKIIFRTTKIIGTLPRIVGRGEIGPKSARLSCGVYPALPIKN